MLDRDKIGLANTRRVGNAAFETLTALQGFTAEQQASAIAVLFVILADRSGIQKGDLMMFADNMLKCDMSYRPEFQAAVDYIDGEIINPKARRR